MQIKTEYSEYFKLRHIFSFSSLNYLQAGLSFFASIILARHLGTEDYGIYTYGLIFANTLVVIMQFGTDKTLVRDLIQLEAPEKVLSSTASIWFMIGVVGIVGTFLWSFFISGLTLFASWVVLFCTLSGFFRGMTVSGWLDFKGKMNLQAIYAVIGKLFFLGGVLLVIFFVNNKTAILWASILLMFGFVISIALEWRFVLRSEKFSFRPVIPSLKGIIKGNSWVFFAAIGNLLMTQANQIILKDKIGVTALAYYGISFQIIMLIRLLQKQIIRIIAPSVATVTDLQHLDAKKTLKDLWKFCFSSLVASLIVLVPLYILTPWIIKQFLGESYLPAIPILHIMYVWAAIFGMALVNNQFLLGLRKEKSFFLITLVFGLFSIVLAHLFIEKYQAVGAALSLLIAHLGSIICQFIVVVSTLKKHPSYAS